jgi:hypothetical protein
MEGRVSSANRMETSMADQGQRTRSKPIMVMPNTDSQTKV